MILANAFCDANPTMAAIIPAPANNAVPNDFRNGIFIKIKMMAREKIIKGIAFFKKEKFVGSLFIICEYFLMEDLSVFLNIMERIRCHYNCSNNKNKIIYIIPVYIYHTFGLNNFIKLIDFLNYIMKI